MNRKQFSFLLRCTVFGLCGCAAACMIPLPVRAMDISTGVTDGGKLIIEADGAIVAGDADRLNDTIARLPDDRKLAAVVVNSPGGLVSEGHAMAQTLHDKSIPMAVTDNGLCASACFMMLYMSPLRFVAQTAKIGVHSASNQAHQEDSGTIDTTLTMAQEAGHFGVPPAVIRKLVATPPGEITFLDSDDLKSMKVEVLPGNTEIEAALPGPGGDGSTGGGKDNGQSAADGQEARAIGPSFLCRPGLSPIAQLICGDRQLSKIDLAFVQAYQALRQETDAEDQPRLRNEAKKFQKQVISNCNIPEAGDVPDGADDMAECVGAAYLKQRQIWLDRIRNRAAAEEAARPLEDHLLLQVGLKLLGFYPPSAQVDGVYSLTTRDAIKDWQESADREVTGLLSDDDAAALIAVAGARAKKVNAMGGIDHAHVTLGPSASRFEQGLADRMAWEAWFGALDGSRQAGAAYWAEQRSLPNAVGCEDANTQSDSAWLAGCLEAQGRLAASDQHRNEDVVYRRGWNFYTDAPQGGDAGSHKE